MREILFRGKDAESGKWLYGWVFGEKAKSIIELDTQYVSEEGVEAYYTSVVIPETVGQYTGLDDKNGKDIFEGDILKDSLGWVCLVKWDDSNGRFLGYHKKPRGDTYVCYVGGKPAQEIIGNIHDNPELMWEKK